MCPAMDKVLHAHSPRQHGPRQNSSGSTCKALQACCALGLGSRTAVKSSLPLQRLLAVEMTNLSHRPALRTYSWVNGAMRGGLATVNVLGVTTLHDNFHPALCGPSPRALRPNSPLTYPTSLPVGQYRLYSYILWKTRFSWVVDREGPVDSRIF